MPLRGTNGDEKCCGAVYFQHSAGVPAGRVGEEEAVEDASAPQDIFVGLRSKTSLAPVR